MTIFGRRRSCSTTWRIDQALLGTSLGANASLEAAAAAPERVRGLLIEMPVLDNALLGCAIAFTPLLVGLTFGAPVARLIGRGASLVPRGLSLVGDMLLDWVSQDRSLGVRAPGAVLRARGAAELRAPRDAAADARDRALPRSVHPFSDSDMLVRELPNARLLEASSILELRLTPERLTGEIVTFIEECFRPRRRSGARKRTATGPRRGASAAAVGVARASAPGSETASRGSSWWTSGRSESA